MHGVRDGLSRAHHVALLGDFLDPFLDRLDLFADALLQLVVASD